MFGISKDRWIGLWVMAVAVIHMAFTPVLYLEEIQHLMAGGFPLDVSPLKVAAGVWFFLFGLPLLGLGNLIDWSERRGLSGLPLALPVLLLLTVGLGIFFYPESGFYLLIPAIIALFFRREVKPA